MKITSAVFEKSSSRLDQCPEDGLPEFAFIGRSNVGKSSLINRICSVKDLAKTSSTPGKTKLINHFRINNRWYLVDLPGYGYASVSKTVKEDFERMIDEYLSASSFLLNTFVLIDIRLEPQDIDLRFIQWMGEQGLPFTLVFTKSDKISATAVRQSVDRYCRVLAETWEELPPIVVSSAKDGRGEQEILESISAVLDQDRS